MLIDIDLLLKSQFLFTKKVIIHDADQMQVLTLVKLTNMHIHLAERDAPTTEETLHQYITIRKLYKELEEEREASASAASEALSMILRLQTEKALEKMEAWQYRRMAEEKLQHARQCLIVLEETMHVKEIEISKLKHQIQLYKRKLLSSSVNDPDIEACEDLSSCRDDVLLDTSGVNGCVRRHISLPQGPQLRLGGLNSEFNCSERNPLLPSEQTICTTLGDCTNQLSVNNKQVPNLFQESTRCHHTTGRNECPNTTSGSSFSSVQETSYSWYSALTGDASDPSNFGTGTYLDHRNASYLPSQAEEEVRTPESATSSTSHSACEIARVQDIFEVPESQKCRCGTVPEEHFFEKSAIGSKTYFFRDDDYLDRVFSYTDHQTGISSRPTGISILHPKKLSSLRKGEMIDCNSVHVDSPNGSFLANNFENIKFQLQQIEHEKMFNMEDPSRSTVHLKLLKDIYELLSTIECHFKNSNASKDPQNRSHVASVTQVSFYCLF